MQPWQFFVLAALGCATAVTFLVRGNGLMPVILLTILMGATALVGMAALRAVRPLVSSQEERVSMIGHRTRAALERDKTIVLRAIKELEFDHAMGRLSEDDFRQMSGRLRSRATRLIRQIDASAGYRSQIQRDLEKRMGGITAPGVQDPIQPDTREKVEVREAAEDLPAGDRRTCASCSMVNDADARFCKECGAKL
jgi:NADH pyrophosphatase NudC (nudix superfamily)